MFKKLIHRPRPISPLIQTVEHLTKNDSFPSGHVMFAIGLYGFLLFLSFTQIKKTHPSRNISLVIFSIPIILMGISRIYLGSHWFSDVLGAYFLSLSWLMVMIWAYRKLDPRVKPA